MKIHLNWALFLLTAASYIFYPVWHLPLPWPAQWALLNVFILLSVAVLYSPLGDASIDAAPPELRELWPVILLAAALCFPFWLTRFPTGNDDQSHAGPAAWVLGRLTSALGIKISLLPLFSLPAAAALFAAWRTLRLPACLTGRGSAALVLAAAGNLFFLASQRFDIAESVGRFETVLRYPPLSKFLYTAAYLFLGVHEAAPRIIEFVFMTATALYMLRLLKFMKADPPPRLTYLLILLFPTFFNLAISAELEAGTVFFFTASIYHFIKAAKTGDRREFTKCAFWTATGLFHKQLLLGLLLAFLPALALLWLKQKENRAAFGYGFKLLAIPAITGLPFILISAAYGIRSSALEYSILADPLTMLLTFKTLYYTSGGFITVLLAVSTVYTVFKHRGLELVVLLYLSAAYHFMISATSAVGFIRHAQPFYIAPVFLLAFWAAETGRISFKGVFIRPAYAVIFALFLFQDFLATDPYQRKTAFNLYTNNFPYREIADHLKSLHSPGLRVYAPMEVEPSHFYLAAAGLAGKLTWNRDMPPSFSAGALAGVFSEGAYDYLLLPGETVPGLPFSFTGAIRGLTGWYGFAVVKTFNYHGNRLLLLRRDEKAAVPATRAGK